MSRELGLLLYSLSGISKYIETESIIPLCFEALCSLRWLAAIERIATAITALIENCKFKANDCHSLANKILLESFTNI